MQYVSAYSRKCSLSYEKIYNLAFLAEKIIENSSSIDSVLECLIEYEQKKEDEKNALGGLKRICGGYQAIGTLDLSNPPRSGTGVPRLGRKENK